MLHAKALNSATDNDGYSKVFELMKKNFDSQEEYERMVAEMRSELSKESPILNCITVEEENGNALGYVIYCFGYSTWDGKTVALQSMYVVDDNEDTMFQALNELRNMVHQLADEHKCRKVTWSSSKDSKFSIDPRVVDMTSLEGWYLYHLPNCRFNDLLKV